MAEIRRHPVDNDNGDASASPRHAKREEECDPTSEVGAWRADLV
jgi:hypothetical protein